MRSGLRVRDVVIVEAIKERLQSSLNLTGAVDWTSHYSNDAENERLMFFMRSRRIAIRAAIGETAPIVRGYAAVDILQRITQQKEFFREFWGVFLYLPTPIRNLVSLTKNLKTKRSEIADGHIPLSIGKE